MSIVLIKENDLTLKREKKRQEADISQKPLLMQTMKMIQCFSQIFQLKQISLYVDSVHVFFLIKMMPFH